MVRISDARMSGTHFGCCVVHVGARRLRSAGPLALIKTGDRVRLDVPAGRLDMLVDDAELSGAAPRGARRSRRTNDLTPRSIKPMSARHPRVATLIFSPAVRPTPEPPIY